MGLKFHQVEEGDNLSTIGARFGVDPAQLARLNKIANPDLIHPGEVIMIPSETSPEDRMRIEGAKQAATYTDERPSQGPKKIDSTGMAFEVDLGRPQRAQPLPGKAQDVVASPTPGPKGQGSLENVHSTSYDPHSPAAMTDPQFWVDFLGKALPEAVQGATGPGAAFVRAAGGLKRMADYAHPEPPGGYSPTGGSNFAQRAQRHFEQNPNEPRDPNYSQVREHRLPEGPPAQSEVKDWNWYRRYSSDAAAPPPMPRNSGWKPTNEDVSFVRRLVEHFGGVPAQYIEDATRGDMLRMRPIIEGQRPGRPQSKMDWDALAYAFKMLAKS